VCLLEYKYSSGCVKRWRKRHGKEERGGQENKYREVRRKKRGVAQTNKLKTNKKKQKQKRGWIDCDGGWGW
jgi:hypothetical protein